MIRNFLIRNSVHLEFGALGTLLLRTFVFRNFVISNFVFRNFVIRNFVPLYLLCPDILKCDPPPVFFPFLHQLSVIKIHTGNLGKTISKN